MKNNITVPIFKYVFLLCIIILFAGITSKEASAFILEVEKDGLYAEYLDDLLYTYAEEQAEIFLEEQFENKKSTLKNQGVSAAGIFTICRAYVYWNHKERQDPIYVFPIAKNDEIVALLKVRGRIEELEDLAAEAPGNAKEIEKLNEIDYLHKDYVFFVYDGSLMAEGKKGKKKKLIDKWTYGTKLSEEEEAEEEERFYAMDYEEKKEAAIAKIENYTFKAERIKPTQDPSFTGLQPLNSWEMNQKAIPWWKKTVIIVVLLILCGFLIVGIYRIMKKKEED